MSEEGGEFSNLINSMKVPDSNKGGGLLDATKPAAGVVTEEPNRSEATKQTWEKLTGKPLESKNK